MGWIENIGGWEMIVIILVGLFIFGPDRLPKAISDGVKILRQLREMARNATGDLSKELGTDIDLDDLRPKNFIRKHLLSEEDEMALRKPLESVYGSLRDELRQVSDTATDIASAINGTPAAPSAVEAVGTGAGTGTAGTGIVGIGTGADTAAPGAAEAEPQPALAPAPTAPPKSDPRRHMDLDAT